MSDNITEYERKDTRSARPSAAGGGTRAYTDVLTARLAERVFFLVISLITMGAFMIEGWLWLVVSGLLVVQGFLRQTYFVYAAAVGAAAVALCLSLSIFSDTIQLVIFFCVAGVATFIMNKMTVYRLGFNNPTPKQALKLLGTKTSVLVSVTQGVGKVQIQDVLWTATSSEDIRAGALVEVVSHDRECLEVAPC